MKMEVIDSTRAADTKATAISAEKVVLTRADVLAELNRVTITGPQMRAAIEAIQHVQVSSASDALEHARLLAQFAADYGFRPPAFAGQALHSRAVAMDRWCHRHDPHGESDVEAFYEAGARAPLIDTEDGPAFEPTEFGDLIQFYAEMPF